MSKNQPANALISRKIDFWLLGAASIIVWAVMMLSQQFKGSSGPVGQRFLQIAPTFAFLALVCNHPHFMLSYKEGYGRGGKFIFKNWFALILVPVILFVIYGSAYFSFQSNASDSILMTKANIFFSYLGIGFRFGTLKNYGTEILSASIWLMYLTVGWHYSKQVFGCMMVYAYYDNFSLNKVERNLIKVNLFAIAFYNFFHIIVNWRELNSALDQQYFFNLPLTNLGLPVIFLALSKYVLIASTILAAIMIGLKMKKKIPSINFFIPWIAFFVWWVPILEQKEFYFMMVPFFHSLQYLPFGYKMMGGGPKAAKSLTWKILFLLAVGFLAFEIIPDFLDGMLNTSLEKTTWFFTIATLVFINVHHYFIDSVVWKFTYPRVKERILFQD